MFPKYLRTHTVTAVVALCVSLGACTKSSDSEPASPLTPGSAVTPKHVDTMQLAQRSGTFEDTISTVAGDVKILDSKLTLGVRTLSDEGDEISAIEAVFDTPGKTTLMLSIGGMGASCPSQYAFLTLKSDGSTSRTDSFGTCSDLPQIAVSNNEISVTMPAMNGRGDETWIYANDTLSKKSTVQAANAEPPTKLTVNEGELVKIRGTLMRDADRWLLSLPKQMILTASEGNSCSGLYVKEIQLMEPPLKDAAKATGEHDFDVTITCPGSRPYAMIESLALPGELPAQVSTQQPSTAPTLPAGTVVQIKLGGVMCGDLDSMKAFVETSRIGECVVAKVSNRTRVLNTQTNFPGWVFVHISSDTAALVRTSDLVLVDSARTPAPQTAAPRGPSITYGATICTDLRSMNRAVALQLAGQTIGLPDECLLAPRTLPTRILGDSPMPGIVAVQIGTQQAFVQRGDLTY